MNQILTTGPEIKDIQLKSMREDLDRKLIFFHIMQPLKPLEDFVSQQMLNKVNPVNKL